MSEALTLAFLIRKAGARGRVIATRDHVLRLDDFEWGSSLGGCLTELEGRSVALWVDDMAKAAAALIDLDGRARRILLCPPGWAASQLAAAMSDTKADCLVLAENDGPPIPVALAAPCRLPLQKIEPTLSARLETEWVLPTSGTSGPPKLAVHTLRTLTAAITEAPLQQWATFYDIRRYGGLQVLLRALGGRGSLHLGTAGEGLDSLLVRFGEAKVTHILGTPSHWRRVLTSAEARRIAPDYVRLSGEIADEAVLSALRQTYPRARIAHAYASTEAGVVFVVDDGKAGFPASWLNGDGAVGIKVADGTLRVRSGRCALRLLGEHETAFADEDGFVDTGDMVEQRNDRLYFLGRRGGIINVGGAKVHPEEVEAALNAHALVRASRVYARKSSIVGALVVADVVLRDERLAPAGVEGEILAACRSSLPPHMVPAKLHFVRDLPMTDGGKLARHE